MSNSVRWSQESEREMIAAARARAMVTLHSRLMQEVMYGPPDARLSAQLRATLERIRPCERRLVVSREASYAPQVRATPLFVAATRGNAEVVEYLVQVCAAPLEQCGQLRYAGGGRGKTHAPPLWAAAAAGRVATLRVLADAGATLNARNDSGDTALRAACQSSRVDVVRELCLRGVDVSGACLADAAHSAELTRLLLAAGAAPGARDAAGRAPLHHAALLGREDTARELLLAGAEPTARCARGTDALGAAAAAGAAGLVALLAEAAPWPRARVAAAHELLGAAWVFAGDARSALLSWQYSTQLRAAPGAGKASRSPAPALGGAREWRSAADLAALADDADALHVQALLVTARVLGDTHDLTLYRMMTRGAWYAEHGRPRRCLQLWSWALELRMRRHSLLHPDTGHALCALTCMLVDACNSAGALNPVVAQYESDEDAADESERWDEWNADVGTVGGFLPFFYPALRLLRLVVHAVPASCPHRGVAAAAWDASLRCALLAAAVAEARATSSQHALLLRELRVLLSATPVTTRGESPLHMACSRLTAVRGPHGPPRRTLFASVPAARLLLEAGASPQARDATGRTPLHIAMLAYNYSAELLEVLLSGGAHACTPDSSGATPASVACAAGRAALHARDRLSCAAARALLAGGAPLAPGLPRTLLAFLDLHRRPQPAPPCRLREKPIL